MKFLLPLALAIIATSASAQPLLLSSSFEYPDITTTGVNYTDADIYYQTFETGQHIGGWRIIDGTVDIVRHKQPTASRGDQSLDLSGISPGAIQRTVSTRPGETYELSFDFSGNGIGGALSIMEVRWGGELMNTFYYDTAPQTNSYQVNMYWQRETLLLTATSRRTTLEFRSLTGGASGPALDRVRLERVRKHRFVTENGKRD